MWVRPWPRTPTQATRTVSFGEANKLERIGTAANAAELRRKYLRFTSEVYHKTSYAVIRIRQLTSLLLDDFVFGHLTVANENDAVSVHRNVVFVRHDDNGVPLLVQPVE